MAGKKSKSKGWVHSLVDFSRKYGRAITAIVAVAGCSYTIGYKSAEVFKEREIMGIENQHSKELLKLKEEYMDKYYQLREQQSKENKNDTIYGKKGI